MEIMITILLIFLLFCLHRIVVLEKRISLNKDRFFITLSEIIETNTMLLEQKDSLKEEKKQLSEEFVRLKKFLLMNDLFRDCLLADSRFKSYQQIEFDVNVKFQSKWIVYLDNGPHHITVTSNRMYWEDGTDYEFKETQPSLSEVSENQ